MNKQLFIDTEALSTLAMAKLGLFAPAKKLMNAQEHEHVQEKKIYKNIFFPFSFILNPGGKRNQKVIKNAQKNEHIDFVCNGQKVGQIIIEGTFKLDMQKRIESFFGTNDTSVKEVASNLGRFGAWAAFGEYEIYHAQIQKDFSMVTKLIKNEAPPRISGMIMSAKPLHRAHEALIRDVLQTCDLLIIFILKQHKTPEYIPFEVRKKSLEFFINNYIIKHRVIIVELEDSYIFSGINKIFLHRLVLKNYGCTKMIVGANYAGLGLHYAQNKPLTSLDEIHLDGINLERYSEKAYCNVCKALVDTDTCAHGHHHHISYNSQAILELFNAGLIVPSILVREEIAAMILEAKYAQKIQNMFYGLTPNKGFVDEIKMQDLYKEIIKLYKTDVF